MPVNTPSPVTANSYPDHGVVVAIPIISSTNKLSGVYKLAVVVGVINVPVKAVPNLSVEVACQLELPDPPPAAPQLRTPEPLFVRTVLAPPCEEGQV